MNDTRRNHLLSRPSTPRIVFVLSLIELVFFGLMALLYQAMPDVVIIGVFVELLTLPMILLWLLLVVVAAILFIKQKFNVKSYPFFSLLLLGFTIWLVMY